MSVVDASVVTAALKPTESWHGASREWLAAALERPGSVRAPAILLPEVTGAVRRATGDSQLAGDVANWLNELEGMELVPVDRRLAERSAELCRDLGVRGCDAVYLALADLLGTDLVTLDEEQIERGSAVVRTARPTANP